MCAVRYLIPIGVRRGEQEIFGSPIIECPRVGDPRKNRRGVDNAHRKRPRGRQFPVACCCFHLKAPAETRLRLDSKLRTRYLQCNRRCCARHRPRNCGGIEIKTLRKHCDERAVFKIAGPEIESARRQNNEPFVRGRGIKILLVQTAQVRIVAAVIRTQLIHLI